MTEWMESGVASWRSGFSERAREESMPMISRLRIFSLREVGRSGRVKERSVE